MAMCSMLYIGPKDTFLAVLPLHHTYQCTCGFLCQVYRGCTVAFCEGLRHITDNLAESKTTMMLCVPLILESIYKRIWKQAEKSGQAKKLKFGIALNRVTKAFGVDLSHKLFAQIHETFGGHLRMFISGAAAIDPKICRGLQDLGISVVQGYGLTECSPIAALNRDVYFKNEAAGLPLDGVRIKINQPDENGVGEIYIKGDNVFMGYYENPDETAKVLKDGWFASGDLGYLDRDSFLHITGRKKNVIVTKNGKNVFPEELETYLGRSCYIAESVVSAKFDTRQDDTIVTAQIVPNFEAVEEALGKDYTELALYDLIKGEVKNVNEKVQIYKRIASFTIRKEEFAKTTTKKIKRYLVKE